MKPSKKNEEIDTMLKKVFGIDRKESINNNTCVRCYGEANEFSDDLSEKEYSISGLCQVCQDEIFGEQ